MKKLNFLLALVLFANSLFAVILIVDANGGGQYTTIQAAINASSTNDTVRVWPGTYIEQVNLNKNILLEGSGYENCIITGSYNPTVTISTGIMQWFQVSSSGGNGIQMSGGTVRNCVIKSCIGTGISFNGTIGYINNCILINNTYSGIYCANTGHVYVFNVIAKNNGGDGLDDAYDYYGGDFLIASYCNANYSTSTTEDVICTNCINTDPLYVSSTDYHISQGSPCKDTGHPSYQDPDGSQSDMGYFGGPWCPTYPTIYQVLTTPGTGSSINLQIKGRANY